MAPRRDHTSKPGKPAPPPKQTRLDLGIYVLLFLAVFAVYGQVRTHAFINFDDPDYVIDNPHVREGLTVHSVEWAFSAVQAANWFPLTWVSHILDYQLFGLESGRHHLTSVFLHALSTLLLFGLLKRMTGARWRSAFVAAIFALHPLHIESVAWIAERKDVLSGLFWFVTLWMYLNYVEKPSRARYLWVVLAFCAGLMSKPMIVTFPLIALALDIWPLQRIGKPAVLEKLPLLALSAASSVLTYIAQERAGAVLSFDHVGIGFRIENALVSLVTYLEEFAWPARLSVFYPYGRLAAWQPVAAAVVLAVITAGVLTVRRQRAYWMAGWLWYLITLVPVIGLVQVGAQSHADRYTYIALIGITLAVTWGVSDLLAARPFGRPILGGLAVVACCGYAMVTAEDLSYWTDSVSLFQHAVGVTSGNYVALNNLGEALAHEGQVEQAVSDLEAALRAKPEFSAAQNNLGYALLLEGKPGEAIPHIREALRLTPSLAEAHVNLGTALIRVGDESAAAAEYREALNMAPDNAEAHSGLGVVLNDQGQVEDALTHLQDAVRLKPEYADGHYNLGRVLAVRGRIEGAIGEFSTAIRLRPADPQAHFNLGTAFVSKEEFPRAIDEFSTAIRLEPDYINARFNLGSALAAVGRLDDAIGQFRELLRERPDFAEAQQSLAAIEQERQANLKNGGR